jgi:hypothetical protein
MRVEAGNDASSCELSAGDARALENLRVSALPLHQLVDHLLDLIDAAVDGETGEVSRHAEDAIDLLNLALETKAEAYGAVCARLSAEADALRLLAKSYSDKASRRADEVKRIKQRLQAEFERAGKTKIKTATCTAYIQASAPAVELSVLTDDEVPDEYCVVERHVSTSKIALALKAGKKLAFATLAQSRHMRFR